MVTQNYNFVAAPIEPSDDTVEREGKLVVKSKEGSGIEIQTDVTIKQTRIGVNSLPKFAIISDLHFDRVSLNNQSAIVREQKLLTALFAKSPNLDAIFICGDYCDSGSESQYNSFFSVFGDPKYCPADVPVYACMGNHEWYTADADTRFKTKFKTNSTNNYIEIKNYPFITISTDNAYTPWYSQATRDFLAASLSDAAAKYPGKPIFVFAHIPVPGTTAGSSAFGSNELTQSLKQYPQVIFFTGHTHHSISDPRSIYQGDFTSVNDGMGWYLSVDGGMVGGIEIPGHDEALEALTARVQTNGDVVIDRWDLYRNNEILPKWEVKAPHDGSAFKYKDIKGEVPFFENPVKPVISKISAAGCKVEWNGAVTPTNNSVVYYYLVEAVNKSTNSVESSAKICSMFFWNENKPKTLEYSISGLTLGKEYFIRITACDAYGNRSTDAIQSDSFITKEYEPDPSVKVPVADLIDLFFSGSTALDRSPLKHTPQAGLNVPTIAFNPTTNSYVATFDAAKSTNYKIWYKDNAVIKNAMAKDFSIECYYKITTQGTKNPFSGLQQGGLGIQHSGYTPTLQAFLGGGYKSLSAGQKLEPTDFYNVIFTYSATDKTMSCYINGIFSSKVTHSGAGLLTIPTSENSQWFGIGADASVAPPGVDYPFDGSIVYCRLYSKVITDDEAYLIDRQNRQRRQITKLDQVNTLLTVTIPAKIAKVNAQSKVILNNIMDEGSALMGDFSITQTNVNQYITKANQAIENAVETSSTPQITVSDENNHAYMTLLTWEPNPELSIMKIKVNGKALSGVNAASGSVLVTGLTPGQQNTVEAVANNGTIDFEPSTLQFTSKGLSDLYEVKDPKMLSNFATYFYACKNFLGTLRANSVTDIAVLPAGRVSYGDLAQIKELILTDDFGASEAGVVDLVQCVNLEKLQIGRSEALKTTTTFTGKNLTAPDNLIGKGALTKEKLSAVLTKKYLPKLTQIGVWIAPSNPVNQSVVTMFSQVATANSIVFNPAVSTSLNLPMAMPTPTAKPSKTNATDVQNLIDRSAWRVVSWSDQEKTPSGSASYPECYVAGMLDGLLSTCYHSGWKEGRPPMPHTVVIDMGKPTTINEFVMIYRNGTGGGRGTNAEIYTVEFSNDAPSSYPTGTPKVGDTPAKNGATMGDFSLTKFPNPASTDGMRWSAPIQVVNNPETAFGTNTFTLPAPVTARTFRLSFTRVQDAVAGQAVNPSEFGFR